MGVSDFLIFICSTKQRLHRPSTEAEPYNLPWEDEDEDAEAQEDNDDDEYEYVEVDADEEIDGEVVDEDPTDGEMQRTLEPYLPLPPPLLPRLNRLEDLPPNFTEEQYAAAIVHGKSIHKPFLHDAPLRYPVAQLHFRSHHPGYLELFCHFAESAASALGIPTSGGYVLPTKRSVWTVPKSPFIYKTSQENFERRVWKRGIKAWDADEEVVKKWVEYLRKHAMGGVGMRVARWERVKLGHGAKVLEDVKKQLGTGERERRIKNVAEWKSDA